MSRDTIHISCASDKDFVMPLTVTLLSLSAHLDRSRKAVISILDGGIPAADREALRRTLKAENIEIRFIKMPDRPFSKEMFVSLHVSIATYYRLMLPDLVSRDLNKIIYLDSDLIVNTDIGKLWDIDIGEKYLLAVQEQGKKSLYVSGGLRYYKELGIEGTEKYFNAGVLVMNLAKWREDHIGPKVIRYVQEHKEHMRYHDQDGLNAVLVHQWGELDHRWNLLSQTFTNPAWEDGPLKDREKYLELIHHPYIIHFNTGSKPWHRGCEHPFAGLFDYYLRKTHYWPVGLKLSCQHFLLRIIPAPVKNAIRKILAQGRGLKS